MPLCLDREHLALGRQKYCRTAGQGSTELVARGLFANILEVIC